MPIPQVRKQRLREATQLSPGGTGLARTVLSAPKEGCRTRARLKALPDGLNIILGDLHLQPDPVISSGVNTSFDTCH